MATRPYTIIQLAHGARNLGIMHVVWTGLLNGDDGQPLDLASFADRTVQLRGTLGVGGTCRAEGSLLDAPAATADYDPLTDPQGNNLDLTTLKIEAVSELTRWIRPRVTGGDGTTSLTLYLIARLAGGR